MKLFINSLTVSRIIMSLVLLPLRTFGAWFYPVYLYCGISDIADGALARRTKTADKAGARLDSAADLVFVAVCFFKLSGAIYLPRSIWLWAGAIALIKVLSALVCLKKSGSYFPHTIPNKLTGFLLFLWVFTIRHIPITMSAVILCAVATLAALWDGYLAVSGKTVINNDE